MTDIRKAVIPAAGMGRRFLPATKVVPKEMLPIVNVPMIQLVVEEAARSGLTQVVLITGHGKEAIERHFGGAPELEERLRGEEDLRRTVRAVAELAEIVTVRQPEPLGVGHAVLCAREAVGDEPFAVLLGDDLYDADPPGIRQLMDLYQEHHKAVVALTEVPEGEEHRYGIVAGDPIGPGILRINDMVEKPPRGTAPSRMAIVGRYVLPPEIFPILSETKPGAGGAIQLTDALRVLGRERGVLGLKVAGTRWDAGERLGFLLANVAYGLRSPELREPLLAFLRAAVAGA